MTDPAPSKTAQIWSWDSKATGSKTTKRGNSDVPRFEQKLLFFFPYKNRNIYLNLCQSSEHLQDTLLTKLLGQFIGLHNI